jgi:hypothetical protein
MDQNGIHLAQNSLEGRGEGRNPEQITDGGDKFPGLTV